MQDENDDVPPEDSGTISETAIMMRVSIGSLALPRSLYMPAKIGMRNRTMPMRTMMAKDPMRIG